MIPSLPGYGFSSRPTETGWGVERIGRAWDALMKRLGYTRYLAQGGDWGAGVVEAMARQAPAGLLGIHTNLPAVFPPAAADAISSRGPAPAGLSEGERAEFDALSTFLRNGGWAYLTMMSARPQAVGYGLTDSPAGLAGWMLVHGGFAKWSYGEDRAQTNEIRIPVAITVFPEDDLFRAPETWARRAFPSLIYYNRVDRGGHFAAWEQPELFAAEMRAAFRSLR